MNKRYWERNGLSGFIENPGTPHAKLVLSRLSQEILEYENIRFIAEQEKRNVDEYKLKSKENTEEKLVQ